MTIQSNISLIASGINSVRNGFETVEVGVAEVAAGIAASWEGNFRWTYGTGDNEVSGLTSLATMFMPVTGENGKPDGKVLPAIYNALPDVFGLEWGEDRNMQSKLKMMFVRAWRIAAAQAVGVDVKFERAGGKAASAITGVSVPLSVAYDLTETDDSGAEKLTELGAKIAGNVKVGLEMATGKPANDKQVLEQMGKLRVDCVGGRHPVFGDVPSATKLVERLVPAVVKAGLMPAPKGRAARADTGVQFVSSLDYVESCLKLLAGDGDESKFAPTDDVESKMRVVAELIAAYFVK